MIDWKRVEELRAEIGTDDFLEVAGMFLEESDQTLDALSEDLTPHAVESLLHFLKGSALNLGLSELAALCQDGEKRAAGGNLTGIDFSHLAMVYQSSKAEFIGGIPKDVAA